jgi:hypothetical protein
MIRYSDRISAGYECGILAPRIHGLPGEGRPWFTNSDVWRALEVSETTNQGMKLKRWHIN